MNRFMDDPAVIAHCSVSFSSAAMFVCNSKGVEDLDSPGLLQHVGCADGCEYYQNMFGNFFRALPSPFLSATSMFIGVSTSTRRI